jgi:hypothetical protein
MSSKADEPVSHKTMNSSVPIASKQASDNEEISQDIESKRENRNTSAEPSLQIRNRNDITKIQAKETQNQIQGVTTKAESRNHENVEMVD